MQGNGLPPAAAEARQRGLGIIPVNREKRCILSTWKPYQIRTPTDDEVNQWVAQNPEGWAVPTGERSGVDVLDFDGPQGLETLRRLGLEPHIRTGSGGAHVYFRHPGWHVPTVAGKIKAELSRVLPGVDIRGDGGYAVVAGENVKGRYEQLRPLEPYAFEDLPKDLRDALRYLSRHERTDLAAGPLPEPQGRVDVSRLVRLALHRVKEGEGRNAAGFQLAVQLRDNGYSQTEAIQTMENYRQRVPPWNSKWSFEEYTAEEATNSVVQAFSRPPREPWAHRTTEVEVELPEVIVTGKQLREVSDEILAAVRLRNDPPFLFVRSGEMVWAPLDENGSIAIKSVSDAVLAGRIARSANLFAKKVRQETVIRVPVFPTAEVVRDILAMAPMTWGIDPLESVTEAPIVGPEGKVLTVAGYDRNMRVLYVPEPNLVVPPISENPTSEEDKAAVDWLHEALCDFPFVGRASFANSIAMLLTPMVRRAVQGNVPAAIVSAPMPGSGKGLLCEIVSIVHTGNLASMKPSPSFEDEEWRKSITALLASGASLAIFDNVEGRVKSPHLASVLTTTSWRDRILGQTKIVTLPQMTSFIINGNNVLLGGDLPRRCYWINLDPRTPEPHKRSGFRHQPLQAWVMAHRGELLAALLTLCRSWYAKGCPDGPNMILGSFENWSRIVGGILANAGIEGFLENFDEHFRQADDTTTQWESFLDKVHEAFDGGGFTIRELISTVEGNENLKELLPDELSDDGRKIAPHLKYAASFRKRIGRRYGHTGIHIIKAGENRNGVTIWRIVRPDLATPAEAESSVPAVPPPGATYQWNS